MPPSAIAKDIELTAAVKSSQQRVGATSDAGQAPDGNTPGAMWNGMIAPFVGVRIKGIAWYQGESNANDAAKYRRILPLMIDGWRNAFADPELPFGIMQLASFMQYRADLPIESGWADLREAQRASASARKAGLIVLLDIGDANDIHPAKKAEAARRLALWARATVYRESIAYSGPLFREAVSRDGALVLQFDHAKGLRSRGGAPCLRVGRRNDRGRDSRSSKCEGGGPCRCSVRLA
jgi:hypothetical protein